MGEAWLQSGGNQPAYTFLQPLPWLEVGLMAGPPENLSPPSPRGAPPLRAPALTQGSGRGEKIEQRSLHVQQVFQVILIQGDDSKATVKKMGLYKITRLPPAGQTWTQVSPGHGQGQRAPPLKGSCWWSPLEAF